MAADKVTGPKDTDGAAKTAQGRGADEQLHLRLRNCLQTILELEPDLQRMDMGEVLLKEFKLLKSFIKRLGDVEVDEQDVHRIETATESFLNELRTPLSLVQEQASRQDINHNQRLH